MIKWLKRAGKKKWAILIGLFIILLISWGWIFLRTSFSTTVSPKPQAKQEYFNQTAKNIQQPLRRELRIRSGETFETVLIKNGFSTTTAALVIEAIRTVFNPRQLMGGNTYSVLTQADGKFTLEYNIDASKVLMVEAEPQKPARAYVLHKKVTTHLKVVRGRISYSLFDAIDALGEKPELADRMAGLFEYDVDFNRDLREDDRFALLVEKKYVGQEFIGYGLIHAAFLANSGREIIVGRHVLSDKSDGYFHDTGEAVERFFLRCPLPFMRLTSHFGNRRHPVLGYSANHGGIDLGAPSGTKVRITASGRIKRVGFDAIRGRFVEASHPNGYETHYYHLQRLESGIRAGRALSQSEVIAFVGNTGRSTGPHLHYGIKRVGRFINPLSLKTPPKRTLPANEFHQFQQRLSLNIFLLSMGDDFLQILSRSVDYFWQAVVMMPTATIPADGE